MLAIQPLHFRIHVYNNHIHDKLAGWPAPLTANA